MYETSPVLREVALAGGVFTILTLLKAVGFTAMLAVFLLLGLFDFGEGSWMRLRLGIFANIPPPRPLSPTQVVISSLLLLTAGFGLAATIFAMLWLCIARFLPTV